MSKRSFESVSPSSSKIYPFLIQAKLEDDEPINHRLPRGSPFNDLSSYDFLVQSIVLNVDYNTCRKFWKGDIYFVLRSSWLRTEAISLDVKLNTMAPIEVFKVPKGEANNPPSSHKCQMPWMQVSNFTLTSQWKIEPLTYQSDSSQNKITGFATLHVLVRPH